MNLLFTLSLPDRTGASKMAMQFARSAVGSGHVVHIAHGPVPPVPTGKTRDEVTFLGELESIGVTCHPVPSLVKSLNFTAVRALRGIIRKHEVSHVVGFNQRDRASAIVAAYLEQAKGIVSAQNQHRFYGTAKRFKRFAYAFCMRNFANRIICTSPIVESEMETFGVPADRLVVLANGVDVGSFPALSEETVRQIRQDLSLSNDARLIVNVARIDPQKGLEYLVRAFCDLDPAAKNWHLALVGGMGEGKALSRSTEYRKGLESTIAQCGAGQYVHFLGKRNDVPQLLHAADVYVHSSVWEGPPIPLAVAEAMAASCPVIFTDCSGTPNAFRHGEDGFLVPKENANALASTMKSLLNMSDEQRQAIGDAARRYALHHCEIRVIGKQFLDLINC